MALTGPAEYQSLVAAIASVDDLTSTLTTVQQELEVLEDLTSSLGIETHEEAVDWKKVHAAEHTERSHLRQIELLETKLVAARAEVVVQKEAAYRDFKDRSEAAIWEARETLAALIPSVDAAIDDYMAVEAEVKALVASVVERPTWADKTRWIPRSIMWTTMDKVVNTFGQLRRFGERP